MNDVELVRRAQEGSHDAFEELMERHRAALIGTAFWLTRDYQAVGDVLQDTMLKAWYALSTVRDQSSFKSWLMRILVNEIRQKARKRQFQTVSVEDVQEHLVAPDDPMQEVLLEEERAALRQGLERLSDEQREILVLRFYADLSAAEIAKSLGVREGTVKSRIHRALQRLGRLIDDRGLRPLEGI